jgi:hypothetical protein
MVDGFFLIVGGMLYAGGYLWRNASGDRIGNPQWDCGGRECRSQS